MKVKEFIKEIQDKYNPDDELYFTIGAAESEHTLDNVEIQEKDDFSQETDIYLSFNEKNRKEFNNAVAEDLKIGIQEALNELAYKYL